MTLEQHPLLFNFEMKIRLFLRFWILIDKFMAWYVRWFDAVPPRTFDAICDQNWYYPIRLKAETKLGVEILYNETTDQLVSRITKQINPTKKVGT